MTPSTTIAPDSSAPDHRLTDPPPTPDLRPLVRKSVTEEALITGWSRLSDTTQRVTVRWPHDHGFYVEGRRYSPLLFTESLRQTLALLTNRVHDVPLDHRLGWERVDSRLDPEALSTKPGPAHVTLLVTHSSVRRRRLGSVQLTSHIEALRAGRPIGTAELQYTTHPPAVYDRLRGRYADARAAFARALPLTPPVPAALVGRSHERDVVLSPTPAAHEWLLRVDVTHRVLFDHPHDHIPGMVLLEAATQATRAVSARPVTPVAFDTSFSRYVEFDRPCSVSAQPVSADPLGRARTRIVAAQDGAVVFASTVTVEPHPA